MGWLLLLCDWWIHQNRAGSETLVVISFLVDWGDRESSKALYPYFGVLSADNLIRLNPKIAVISPYMFSKSISEKAGGNLQQVQATVLTYVDW